MNTIKDDIQAGINSIKDQLQNLEEIIKQLEEKKLKEGLKQSDEEE